MRREYISKNLRTYELMFNESYDITTVLEISYVEDDNSIFKGEENLKVKLVGYCYGEFNNVEVMEFIINMINEYESKHL